MNKILFARCSTLFSPHYTAQATNSMTLKALGRVTRTTCTCSLNTWKNANWNMRTLFQVDIHSVNFWGRTGAAVVYGGKWPRLRTNITHHWRCPFPSPLSVLPSSTSRKPFFLPSHHTAIPYANKQMTSSLLYILHMYSPPNVMSFLSHFIHT